MKEILFEKGYKKEILLSLGFFDCVHRGHGYLIDCAAERAKQINAENFVFTFCNNPYVFFKDGEKEIFVFEERKALLQKHGIDGIIYAEMNNAFLTQSPEIFINNLFSFYDVKEVFCGSDYTFGYHGLGNVDLLKRFAAEKNIKVNVVDFVLSDGQKISSTDIRRYLKNGDIESTNGLLGHTYHITGKVIHNFGRGRVMGFPTANVELNVEKLYPQEAVYATAVTVDGATFNAITNVGKKPTFNDDSLSVESFIIGFDKNLYGKEITVDFYKKIRDIEKFENADQFIIQLKKDIITSNEIRRQL